MLLLAFVIELVIMFGAPVACGWFIGRRWALSWRLFWVGAVTFIASQVLHIPLNAGLTALFRLAWMPRPPDAWQLPFNVIVLGLTAGLCEESARYLVYRFWLRGARTWRQALMFGAGHGGIESAITGLLVGVALVNMIVLRDVDVATLGLPPEQIAQAARQVAEFWAMPAYMPLLAAVERLLSIVFHLSAAALVMQALLRQRMWPLWTAMGWHATVNAITLYVNNAYGAVAAEASLAALSLVSAGILWATWRADRQRELKVASL